MAPGGGADYHDQTAGHWIDGQIATPMSVHEEYRATRSSFGLNVLGTVVAEVEAEDGTVGIGTSTGGPPAAWLVEHHLSRFVEGKRADEIELAWDQMWRGSLYYGRKGLAVNALSAVDLALWDLLGRLRDEPVHAYDCWMSLTVEYTLRLIEALRPYRFKWIEEFLPPDDYWGYAEVRRRAPHEILLTTGEHAWSRWGFRLLIDNHCCDVVQPDVNWCGGLTELLKIAAYASAHGVLVVPHGSSVYSYHFRRHPARKPVRGVPDDGTGRRLDRAHVHAAPHRRAGAPARAHPGLRARPARLRRRARPHVAARAAVRPLTLSRAGRSRSASPPSRRRRANARTPCTPGGRHRSPRR